MFRIMLAVSFSATALAGPAYAGSNFCGRIKSLPDGFTVLSKGKEIYLASDNSAPADPKGVLDYLTTHHADRDHGCYCISGSARAYRFVEVTGLTKCGGSVLK